MASARNENHERPARPHQSNELRRKPMIDRGTEQTSPQAQQSPRQRAISAYEDARGRATDTLGQAPLIALAGGIAAGALIAALLPRTEAETRLVRPTAKRVKDSARAALDAARSTSKQRFQDLGFTRDKGEETIRNLLS